MKPKFTDQLITGKGLPEMTFVNESTNKVIAKAASLDLPSPTKANIPPLEQKQHSLDTDSGTKNRRDCFKKAGGDIHPTKLGDTHLSVKEPESPSHTEIDKVRKSPGKGKGNGHKVKGKKSPNGNKHKDPQRKKSLSLSDLSSKLKRKFSRSDSETKDAEVVARGLHVGKATFYNTESLENATNEGTASSNSETGSNSGDAFESSGTSNENAKDETNSTSDTGDKEQKSNCTELVSHGDSEGTNLIKTEKNQTDSPVEETNESDSLVSNVDKKEKPPCDEDVYENIEYSVSSQELYQNAEIVTEHEKGIKKLVPIPVIEIEGNGTESSNTIGPSQDYMPMNVRRTDIDRSTLKADVYDNAEFSTKMYDNSLYEQTESVYEAYEFHKARELREISRRSKFRKTAKKQKAILLEDDKYEPVNDKQVEGKDVVNLNRLSCTSTIISCL